MAHRQRIGAVDDAIERLSFPTTRAEASLLVGGIAVQTGERTTSLSKLVNRLDEERFESAEDLLDAIYAIVPPADENGR